MPSSDPGARAPAFSGENYCQVFVFLGLLDCSYGGMENHGHRLLQWLGQAGHRYAFGASFVKDELGRTARLDEHGEAVDWCNSAQELACVLASLTTSSRVVMFFNTGHWIEDLATLRKGRPGAMFIARTGGNEILQAPLIDMSIRHRDRQAVWVSTINRCIDVLITNSVFTEHRLLALGVKAQLCTRIPGGVDAEAASQLQGSRPKRKVLAARRVVWAGRFVEFKGLHVLLDAMHALAHEDVELVLIGDGPLLQDVKDGATRRGMGTRVHFTGPLAPHECLEVMATCNLYVALSLAQERLVPGGSYLHTETMGRSVMEALCCGLRVVASNVGGLTELIEPSLGELVPAGDANAAAAAIARQLALPPLEETCRLALAAEYDWTNVFRRYTALWSKAHA